MQLTGLIEHIFDFDLAIINIAENSTYIITCRKIGIHDSYIFNNRGIFCPLSNTKKTNIVSTVNIVESGNCMAPAVERSFERTRSLAYRSPRLMIAIRRCNYITIDSDVLRKYRTNIL